MVGIKHHTPATATTAKIAWQTYNEAHDKGATADVLTDHNKALHDALGIDAVTLQGSTVTEIQAGVTVADSSASGEVKLYNLLQGDIPFGWHLCDGTNGTEDLSAINPSVNTVYIQYVGGEYTNMTSRTINITDTTGANITTELAAPTDEGTAITDIEDGAPFYLKLTNTTGGALVPIVTCSRTSDGYRIFGAHLTSVDAAADTTIILTQYVDCTWTIATE